MTRWFQCFALGTALSRSQLSLSLLVAVHVYMCVCLREHACLCVCMSVCAHMCLLRACYMHVCLCILLWFPSHLGLGCSAGYHLPLPTRQTPYLRGSLPSPQKAPFPCGECEEVGTVSTAGVRHLGQLTWIHGGVEGGVLEGEAVVWVCHLAWAVKGRRYKRERAK